MILLFNNQRRITLLLLVLGMLLLDMTGAQRNREGNPNCKYHNKKVKDRKNKRCNC